MVKETVTVTVTKTCSHCGHDAHNARTCLNGVNKRIVKLFGVSISSDPIMSPEVTELRKSLSMGNLDSLLANANGNSNSDLVAAVEEASYHSDGQIHSKKGKTIKRKGKPWTEEEHLIFLVGLKKLGKGNWRGIAKNFVTTRTPTQVASHAQKYFVRLSSSDKRRNRASVFDISLKTQENERNPQDASTSTSSSSLKTLSKQPQTRSQEPVQGLMQTKISNRFQNQSVAYMPSYQTGPSYYNVPSLMYHPMYYANPELVKFVHPSGVPIPRDLSIGLPQPQSNQALDMTEKRHGIDFDLPPSSSQDTGATDLTAHGFIHAK